MKLIYIFLLISICLTSCTRNTKTVPAMVDIPVVTNDTKYLPDTLIKQDIGYNEGHYYLQTYVYTDSAHQVVPSHVGNWGIDGNSTIAPYDNFITGSFEYIKRNKHKEYKKAYDFIYTKANKKKNIDDSIDILKKL